MAEKNKGGRPQYEPTDKDRQTVRIMAMCGMGQPEIARAIGDTGISLPTLRKHFRDELDKGGTEANTKIAMNLYKRAMGDGPQSVTAAIFWLKCRAGWKETSVTEVSGKDGEPLPANGQAVVIYALPDNGRDN